MLPPPLDMSTQPEPALPAPYVYAPAGPLKSIFNAPAEPDYAPATQPRIAVAPAPNPPPRQQAPLFPQKPSSPSVALGPSVPAPPTRPIDLNVAAPAVVALAPSPTPGPEKKTDGVELAPKPPALNQFDRFTAVYDLMAHTVFLPDGSRLEAHSGLGPLGTIPPMSWKRTGARRRRMNMNSRCARACSTACRRCGSIPSAGRMRSMAAPGCSPTPTCWGPDGDSNGCVSFKNYDAFLAAFQSGPSRSLSS